MRTGLVGCVKGKAAVALPAQDLYISTLFAGRRAYVERSCDRWFILSARHGLVEPSKIIEPYDEALQDVSARDRREWARLVVRQLVDAIDAIADETFEVHAGNAYVGYGLASGLVAMGADVELPAAGLPIGKLLAFYAGNGGTALQRERRPKRATMPDDPLQTYLSGASSPVILRFSEIETIIGRALPPSARKHSAWWANSVDRTLARHWLAAGWRADGVDLAAQQIRLVR